MKTDKYVGLFISPDSNSYTLVVYCTSFSQAFFLLTADAIRSGMTGQLHSIKSEDNVIKMVGNESLLLSGAIFPMLSNC